MNKTYETICKLVSTAMFGSAISYDTDIDWVDVFEEMKMHGIASLVGDILNDIHMEDEVKEKWKDYIFQQQIYWKRAITVQDDVCRNLHEIPYVIIKGMSASIYYPNPGLRSLGDIDVLVKKDNFDIATELLKRNNYLVLTESAGRHNEYCKNGIEIELHNSYASELERAGNMNVENRITTAIDIAKQLHYKEYVWKALPQVENGLSLLYHILHHFRYYGFGYRQIIDWMMFVNHSSDIDWNEFNRITKLDGIFKLQCAVTKLCSLNFGLPKTDSIMWMDDTNMDVCKKMFSYVSTRGNFGIKLSDMDFRDQLTLKNKTTGLMTRLQSGGMHRWKAAKKHKVLRPFAWIYQGCRVFKIMIQRKDPIKAISRDVEESKKIIELYDKLDIPRIDARGEKHK